MTKVCVAGIPLMAALLGCSGGVDPQTLVTPDSAGDKLAFAEPVEHVDLLARETMVVEHPSGVLFVAGYGGSNLGEPPLLWKSADGGASWERVDVGTDDDGADGNSDVDLAVGPDGTLYFLCMGFDRNVGEGTHMAVGVSHDGGASWSWTYLSQDRFDDRPWIEVAPDGTAHAIWNDGQGVCHATSRDGGRTWVEQPRIHDKGGSSHMAVGPGGELAVRIAPASASGNQFDEGVEFVAVSLDGGRSWNKHPPPAQLQWDPTLEDPDIVSRWVEPLAWDAAGALYHLWSEGQELWLGRSIDHGGSWTKWAVARADDWVYFPYLTARGSGELAATWFSGVDDNMRQHVARIDLADGDGATPRVRELEPFQSDAWNRDGEHRDTAGEYFPVIFLSDGDLAVTTTIQNPNTERFGFTWRRIN